MKSKSIKIGLVILGYLLALVFACLAFFIRYIFTLGPAAQAAGGMYAEGDVFLFMGVLGLSSIFPTGLGFYFLRSNEKFWNFFSFFSLGLALTGPLAEAALIGIKAFRIDQGSFWAMVTLLGTMRLFATVVLGAGFIVLALLAPQKRTRTILLIASGIEIGLFLFVGVLYMGWNRLF